MEMHNWATDGLLVKPRGEVLTTTPRRLSLVVRAATNRRAWADADSIRFAGFDSVASALAYGKLDIARVVIDEQGTALDFLRLLASVPATATPDLLWITPERSFLSALGRGGDRILYELGASEVLFYLWVNDLLETRCGAVPSPEGEGAERSEAGEGRRCRHAEVRTDETARIRPLPSRTMFDESQHLVHAE
jgi:hypothetical protein